MGSNLKISIILPVYNSEKYLRNCIESIINQTYKNWELIIVNDGSTDNSGLICNEFSNIDNRIFVIHKSNEGVSCARNVALKHIAGDYVTFVDSDDFLEPFTLQTYIDEIYINNSDIIKVGYYKEYKNNNHDIVSTGENFLLNNTWELYKILEKSCYYSFLWNMCIRRSCLTNIQFDNNISWCEDQIFSYQCYFNCKQISVLKDVCYHYQIHESGSLSDIKDPFIIKIANEKERKYKLMLNAGFLSEIDKEIEDCYAYRLHRIVDLLYSYNHSFKERLYYSKKCEVRRLIYKEEKIFFNKFIPFCLRDILLIMYYSFKRTKFIIKVLF